MRTLLILPIYNEVDNLAPLLERIDAARTSAGLDLDVLAVDDGSRDGSYKRLAGLKRRFPYLAIARHRDNRGFAGAVRTGLEKGLAADYEAMALMDADLTHDPADLPALLEAVRLGADVAVGSRYVAGGGMESVPFSRSAISRIGNAVGRRVLKAPIGDLTSGYRAYRRAVLERVALLEDGFGIQLEAAVKAHRAGFRLVEVPITLRVRTHGYSKMVYNLGFWWSYARLFARLAALGVGPGHAAEPVRVSRSTDTGRRSSATRRRARAESGPIGRGEERREGAGGPPRCSVSVVVTVLNEEQTIERLLESLARQSRRADEIIIVDGGSSDDTQARIAAWQGRLPLHLIVLPGANISQGRNAGTAASRSEVIAVTDAGVRLSEHWLHEIVRPLEQVDPSDVVGGFFRSDPQTVFDLAMGATVLPLESEIDPQRFLPSSRSVAFRKGAWKQAGGYPEWLDYCEDLVFDLQLKHQGHRFTWAPDALVYFRPRSSLPAFFRQYYLYARGDGKAGLWPRRHLARYAAYVIGALAVSASFHRRDDESRPQLPRQRWLTALLLGVGASLYLVRPYTRLAPHLRQLPPGRAAQAVALVPIIRAAGDLAKMAGYPVGLWWRWRK